MIGGHCGKCGAPYMLPDVWNSVTPPVPQPTCCCWNVPGSVTTSGITVTTTDDVETDRARLLAAAEGLAGEVRAVFCDPATCVDAFCPRYHQPKVTAALAAWDEAKGDRR